MCVNYKLCVKLHKGPFAFNMEKFPSLENFYTHAVTGVTDNYQVCGDATWKCTNFKFPLIFVVPCHDTGLD